jgi:hypothetical protein
MRVCTMALLPRPLRLVGIMICLWELRTSATVSRATWLKRAPVAAPFTQIRLHNPQFTLLNGD